MRKEIHENTLNIYKEDGTLISTTVTKTYVIFPDQDKVIRNKLNGHVVDTFIGIGSNDSIDNYEEINKEAK